MLHYFLISIFLDRFLHYNFNCQINNFLNENRLKYYDDN